jgi:hypothetical protein
MYIMFIRAGRGFGGRCCGIIVVATIITTRLQPQDTSGVEV